MSLEWRSLLPLRAVLLLAQTSLLMLLGTCLPIKLLLEFDGQSGVTAFPGSSHAILGGGKLSFQKGDSGGCIVKGCDRLLPLAGDSFDSIARHKLQ